MITPEHWGCAEQTAEMVLNALRQKFDYKQIKEKEVKEGSRERFWGKFYYTERLTKRLLVDFYRAKESSMRGQTTYANKISRVEVIIDDNMLESEEKFNKSMEQVLIHELTHSWQLYRDLFIEEKDLETYTGGGGEEKFFNYLVRNEEIDAQLSVFHHFNKDAFSLSIDDFKQKLCNFYRKNLVATDELVAKIVDHIVKNKLMNYKKI